MASKYAYSLLGIPYIWGGNHTLEGFDCSGLVQEILKSVGADPKWDQTSQGIFNYFYVHGQICEPKCGALSFYGKSQDDICHVGFCLNDYQMIEAGGGGSHTKTIEDARRQGAFVRVRPIMHRYDYLHCLMPDY